MFTIDLPRSPSRARRRRGARTRGDGRDVRDDVRWTCLRVLLVEDETDTGRNAGGVSRELGADVIYFETAAARWRPWIRPSRHVPRQRHRLPVEDGYELLRAHSRRTRRNPVPAIALGPPSRARKTCTGRSRPALDVHLAKPVEPADCPLVAQVARSPRRG